MVVVARPLVEARAARIHLEPREKPPLFHFARLKERWQRGRWSFQMLCLLSGWLVSGWLVSGERLNAAASSDANAAPVLSSAEAKTRLAADPTDPTLYLQASLAAYQAGDTDEAVRILEQGRIRAEPSSELLVALATLYVQQNRLADAAELAGAALELDPECQVAHLRLGEIYLQSGWLENARGSLRRAVELDPECGEAWLLLGLALWGQRLHQDAASALAHACANLEPPTAAYEALGELRLAESRHQEAGRFFRMALGVNPVAPAAQRGLVASLTADGHPQAAAALCQEYLSSTPDRIDLWLALGEAQEKQDQLAEAFTCYGKALDLDSSCAAAHSRRGRLYCRYGQFAAAVVECRAALHLDHDDGIAHAYLGIAYANLGQPDQAQAHALRAEAAGMHMQSVWDKLGR